MVTSPPCGDALDQDPERFEKDKVHNFAVYYGNQVSKRARNDRPRFVVKPRTPHCPWSAALTELPEGYQRPAPVFVKITGNSLKMSVVYSRPTVETSKCLRLNPSSAEIDYIILIDSYLASG